MAWVVETWRGSNEVSSPYLTDTCAVCNGARAGWFCLNDDATTGKRNHRHVYLCALHEDREWLNVVLLKDLVGA